MKKTKRTKKQPKVEFSQFWSIIIRSCSNIAVRSPKTSQHWFAKFDISVKSDFMTRILEKNQFSKGFPLIFHFTVWNHGQRDLKLKAINWVYMAVSLSHTIFVTRFQLTFWQFEISWPATDNILWLRMWLFTLQAEQKNSNPSSVINPIDELLYKQWNIPGEDRKRHLARKVLFEVFSPTEWWS